LETKIYLETPHVVSCFLNGLLALEKRPPFPKTALNQNTDAQQHVPTNFIYGLGVVGGVGVGGAAEPFPPAGGKVLSRNSSRTPALADRTGSRRPPVAGGGREIVRRGRPVCGLDESDGANQPDSSGSSAEVPLE